MIFFRLGLVTLKCASNISEPFTKVTDCLFWLFGKRVKETVFLFLNISQKQS